MEFTVLEIRFQTIVLETYETFYKSKYFIKHTSNNRT